MHHWVIWFLTLARNWAEAGISCQRDVFRRKGAVVYTTDTFGNSVTCSATEGTHGDFKQMVQRRLLIILVLPPRLLFKQS